MTETSPALAEYLNLCAAIGAMTSEDPELDAALDAADKLWEGLTDDERRASVVSTGNGAVPYLGVVETVELEPIVIDPDELDARAWAAEVLR